MGRGKENERHETSSHHKRLEKISSLLRYEYGEPGARHGLISLEVSLLFVFKRVLV